MRRRAAQAAGAALIVASAAGCVLVTGRRSNEPSSPKLGRPAAQDVIRRMDITVMADGTGLPPGSGSVAQGRATFAAKCTSCHGPEGTGFAAEPLTGTAEPDASAKPVRTIAAYWPYAPTLFDYIRRAMPLTAPQSLSDEEVYGLVAYLLSVDGIVAPDARLDRSTLSRVDMPNRHGFVSLEGRDFDGNIERVPSPHAKGE